MVAERSSMSGRDRVKVGLLLDTLYVEAWVFKMVESLATSDFADLSLIVRNASYSRHLKNKQSIDNASLRHYPRIFVRKSLNTLHKVLLDRSSYIQNAQEIKDLSSLLEGVKILDLEPINDEGVDYFSQPDIDNIREDNIDVFIRCGFQVLGGNILHLANYGLWSHTHGTDLSGYGQTAGFWESLKSHPETLSGLKILPDDKGKGVFICQSSSCTNPLSVKDNRSNYLWKMSTFVPRNVEHIYRYGADSFLEKLDQKEVQSHQLDGQVLKEPNNTEYLALIFSNLYKKAQHRIRNHRYHTQWILLYKLGEESSNKSSYKKMIPAIDTGWADPHVIYRDGVYYIFIEEIEYAKKDGKGRLAVIKMDQHGNYEPPRVILDLDYHLSYPFVFEHDGDMYMVPESGEAKVLDLYKCEEFPYKWQHAARLMDGKEIFDATLLYHQGKWWLFANITPVEGASDWDELHLFYRDDLFSGDWKEHRQNPIVSDVKRARPAGRVFESNNKLIRPSQNCSVRYGYGVQFNEIVELNESSYKEELISSIEPDWDKSIIGVHTYSRDKQLSVIDGQYLHPRK